MKNMKVKKALMAMGAVFALGMAVQAHAQTDPTPAPLDDASVLSAALASDYAAANADLAAQCGASVEGNAAAADGSVSTFCPDDGRTYYTDPTGGAPTAPPV